ncbi:MAG: hypothetical protein QOK44_4587 [Betaproteobacteria bacterium]|nr:hypothetical protein [Betaproteobacteria bacterium]
MLNENRPPLVFRIPHSALVLDGRLVDIASIRMAQNVLAKAEAVGGSPKAPA